MILFYQALANQFQELHSEILNTLDSIPDEALDWKPGEEMNSIGVIITHLAGATRYLIGDIVMGEPSNRNREAEFLASGMSKSDLEHRLKDTQAYITESFEKLSLADLETTRIHPLHGNQVSVAWALLHALEHTGNHAGHIELTVQLWQDQNAKKS